MRVQKYKLNFVVDVLLYLLMLALAGTGLLLRYVIVPGRDVQLKYGAGWDPRLFGLDRHAWAEIHLVLAFALLGLFVLHIVLHWRTVLGMFRGMVAYPRIRRFSTALLATASLFLLTFFLLFEPDLEVFERGTGRAGRPVADMGAGFGNRQPAMRESPPPDEDCVIAAPDPVSSEAAAPEETGEHLAGGPEPEHSSPDKLEMVRGMYSIGAIADRHGIPLKRLIEGLGLPPGTSPQVQLGRLRRKYGFRMSDVERVVLEYSREGI